jgi:hypothetical protein
MELVQECNEQMYYFKIQNYDLTKDYTQVLLAHNEVFVRTITVINGIWHFLLQNVGPERNAGRFCYTVSFVKDDDDVAIMKVSHWCRSIYENVNEIYQACKCIMLPAAVIKSTMDDGQLVYCFKIKKY